MAKFEQGDRVKIADAVPAKHTGLMEAEILKNQIEAYAGQEAIVSHVNGDGSVNIRHVDKNGVFTNESVNFPPEALSAVPTEAAG